jgi:hypothetical protein
MGKYGFHPTVFLDNLQRRIFTNSSPRRYVIYTDTEFSIEPVYIACYYQEYHNSPIILIEELEQNGIKIKIPIKLRN